MGLEKHNHVDCKHGVIHENYNPEKHVHAGNCETLCALQTGRPPALPGRFMLAVRQCAARRPPSPPAIAGRFTMAVRLRSV
jgi:hypothetical protein